MGKISNAYIVKNYSDPTGIYVNKDGDDACNGSFYKPVATVTAALALVSSTRKVINVAPGAYAEAAALTWPSIGGVSLVGAGSSLTSISATGTTVFSVNPTAQTSTFTGLIQDIEIDHSAGDGQSGITFNNTSVARKLNFSLKGIGYSWDEDTDKSINIATHVTGNAIRIYCSGYGDQTEVGAIYFKVNDNADRLHLENMWLMCTTTLSGADQIRVRALRCVIPEHTVAVAFVGDSGLQTVTLVDCWQWTDYDDTVAEIFEHAESGNVTGSTAVVVAYS